jgi:hypothetical protein
MYMMHFYNSMPLLTLAGLTTSACFYYVVLSDYR